MRVSPAFLIAFGLGAVAAYVGWHLDNDVAALATSFVCGMIGVIGQIGVSSLLQRTQFLVDRGINQCVEDGGELRDDACNLRDKTFKFAGWALIAGVLAPTSATLGVLLKHKVFGAIALFLGVVAVVLYIFLLGAGRELTRRLEDDQEAQVRQKHNADTHANWQPPPPKPPDDHPNLGGYEVQKPNVSPNRDI